MKYQEHIAELKSKKKDEVVVKAYWLFIEKGIDTVTLEDVAKEADISPATIYRYFGDKKTLLIECGKRFWEETYELNNPTKAKKFNQMTGYEQTEALMSAFIPALLKFPQHLRFLRYFDVYMEQCHVSQEELKGYDESIIGWADYCRNALTKGKKDHTIRADLRFEPFYLTATHILLSLAQKLACSPELLPSDSLSTQKEQITLAVRILTEYIKPRTK